MSNKNFSHLELDKELTFTISKETAILIRSLFKDKADEFRTMEGDKISGRAVRDMRAFMKSLPEFPKEMYAYP